MSIMAAACMLATASVVTLVAALTVVVAGGGAVAVRVPAITRTTRMLRVVSVPAAGAVMSRCLPAAVLDCSMAAVALPSGCVAGLAGLMIGRSAAGTVVTGRPMRCRGAMVPRVAGTASAVAGGVAGGCEAVRSSCLPISVSVQGTMRLIGMPMRRTVGVLRMGVPGVSVGGVSVMRVLGAVVAAGDVDELTLPAGMLRAGFVLDEDVLVLGQFHQFGRRLGGQDQGFDVDFEIVGGHGGALSGVR